MRLTSWRIAYGPSRPIRRSFSTATFSASVTWTACSIGRSASACHQSRTPRRRVCSSGRSFGAAGARPSRIGGSTGGGGPAIGRDGVVAGGPAALPGQPWSGSGPGRAGAAPGHAGGGPSRRSPADLVRQHCERHGVRHLESPDGRPVAMATCVLVGWLISSPERPGPAGRIFSAETLARDGGLDARSFRAAVHLLVEACRIVRAVRDSRRKPRGRGPECRGEAGGRGGGGVIDVDLGGSSTGCSWPAAPRRARTNNGRLTSCGGRSRSTAAVHLCALWLLVRAAVTLTAGRRSGDTTGRGA